MIKLAIVASNNVSIRDCAKKGTEIFVNILVKNLHEKAKKNNIGITAFASGDSVLPVGIEKVNHTASSKDKTIPDEKHIIFELALLSNAFSRQNEFDIFHINIGDGDIALPFIPFVKKPVLITFHNTVEAKYVKKYFSLYKKFKNVSFISASNAQRKLLPGINYAATIYHGIDIKKWKFSETGGENINWAGRAIPEKGPDEVIEVSNRANRKAKLFAISKSEHKNWFQSEVVKKIRNISDTRIYYNTERSKLLPHYQTSRLFLLPIKFEEAFGLVVIESIACGTPVVAYARGSIPEVVEDGVTGLIVNPSKTDIRGKWIIKKTGIEGLCEAVNRIYSLSESKYLKMRLSCRRAVEKKFTVERMVDDYINIYKKLGSNTNL